MTGRAAEKTTCLHSTLPGKYDLLSLLENSPDSYPFLLETTAESSDPAAAEFDILFAFPQKFIIKHPDNTISVSGGKTDNKNFLDQLDYEWKREATQVPNDISLPFTGGWFLYLGYELAGEIEPTIEMQQPDDGFPVAFAARIPAAILYERHRKQTHIIAEANYPELFEKIKSDIGSIKYNNEIPSSDLVDEITEEDPEIYISSLKKIHDFIREGDVFQVNLSRRWAASLKQDVTDIEVFRKLRESNPAPFSALVKFENNTIVSSSPERLIRTQNSRIETRPIAGTRPRGKTSVNDADLKNELFSNKKEQAEHIMLIDLERNDLGRICVAGSIHVDEFMVLESYAHVHHIVSNVSGKMNPDITPGQIIRAVFPGGTITGCPKVRCMEIIKELEQTARSAYTGSLGYLNHNGDMDLNILIRTLMIHDRQVTFRAGAGIVADSVADREVKETQAKARGMILALQD